MTAKIFIDGESGTTGLGIRARLEAYPKIELLGLPADQRKDPAAKQAAMEQADIVVLCLPDEAAREAAAIEPAHSRRLDCAPGCGRLDVRLSRACPRPG